MRLVNGARPQERLEARALQDAKLAQLERAELAWNRIYELRRNRAVAEQEVDDQRTLTAALRAEVDAAKARHDLLEAPAREDELLMANARIEAAQAGVCLAELQVERGMLRAPRPGQLLKIGVETGELTGPESIEPVIVMAETGQYQVRTFVEELDAPRVEVGMMANIEADGLPNRKLRGTVIRLSPRMDHKRLWADKPSERYDTKTREVWIALEKSDPMVIWLRVDVTIQPSAKRSTGS
jgi:HlyD family secretion protein